MGQPLIPSGTPTHKTELAPANTSDCSRLHSLSNSATFSAANPFPIPPKSN